MAQILINRDIKTSGEIDCFLKPSISQLSDPFELAGIKTAVDRIATASKSGEKVLVHGDYDADGLTATAILLNALKQTGIDACHFIPNRMEHGYGFTAASAKKAKQMGVGLLITVDCGITSFEAASLCKTMGIDVIITDHHEPVSSAMKGSEGEDFRLPDALAVINPKICSLLSPVSNLSGAGVAFKLAHALAVVHNSESEVYDFLDLAALGTMADVVPLTGENRIIVKEGLRVMENGARLGLQALQRVAGIEGKVLKTGLLLFTIIPRINAAGRISDPNNVLNLLLTDSEDEANDLSSWLDRLNSERQQIEEEVYQEAVSMLNSRDMPQVIVLSSEGWHKGVIGIVASRIAEKFYRPTFILSVEGAVARGSARSIPSFDIYNALTGCKEFLKGFGGHKQAAGLELDAGNISSFDDCINRIAYETLSEKDYIPSLEIDADVEFSDISFDLIKELELLEPFGFGNSEPFFGSKGLDVLYPRILKNNHLKMKLRQKNRTIDAIGFNMAASFDKIATATKVDAVFSPHVNEWEGVRSLQLNLKALRPSR